MDFERYGFYDYLCADFPSQIVVDVTEICNLACIHCPHDNFTRSDNYKGRQLPLELNKKLVDEIKKDGLMKCKYIRYTGHGEPFKHPHILEMLKYTKENLDIPVNLTTNGTMLTKDASLFLLETGINVIDISIDAYKEETYLAIRGADKLKQTAENVRELISLNKENNFDTKVIVSFIQQPLNSAETDDFKIYWTTEGADYVVIRALHSAAGEKCDVFQNDLTSATTEKRRPCLYPWERLILNADGYLGFCPADWKYKSQIGNFKDVSIKQAWTGEHMRKTRKFHLENTFAELELCGNCPDWKETNWPNSGRSYSKLMQDLTANAHGDN